MFFMLFALLIFFLYLLFKHIWLFENITINKLIYYGFSSLFFRLVLLDLLL